MLQQIGFLMLNTQKLFVNMKLCISETENTSPQKMNYLYDKSVK